MSRGEFSPSFFVVLAKVEAAEGKRDDGEEGEGARTSTASLIKCTNRRVLRRFRWVRAAGALV